MTRSLAAFALLFATSFPVAPAAAAPRDVVLVDRVVARFWAPEIGGRGAPRTITERVLAFEARVEALSEGDRSPAAGYQERFVRAAVDRHVAEEMLAALLLERGTEPYELPKLVTDARRSLVDRVGGPLAFAEVVAAEGISEAELSNLLRRQVRALYYVDHTIEPISHPREEELREAYSSTLHPYGSARYDDIRAALEGWLVVERLRAAEISFLQSARTRVRIVVEPQTPPPSTLENP